MHDVINPATELVVASVPSASLEETDAAIARAQAALPAWRDVAPGGPSRDAAPLLRRRPGAHRGARPARGGQRRPHDQQRPLGGQQRRQRAGLLRRRARAPVRPADPRRRRHRHHVQGAASASSASSCPWNFPMPIAGWGFAPALAAGCTVVLKPAELTPLTAIRLGELALEAGLPEDVFIVLPGKGSVVGQRFVDHPDVRKVVFTGSTEVGQRIMAGCAQQVKAGHPGARRQERQRDLRRRRPREGGGHRAVRRVRQRRPGLLRALAHPRPAVGLRPVHGAVRDRRQGRHGRGPAPRLHRDGPADHRAHHETVARLPRTAPRRSRSRATRPTGPASGSRRPSSRPVDPTARVFQEEIFGPVVVGDPVRGRGRRDPAGQRLRLRAVRLDLDPRPRPRHPGRRAASSRATCRSTRTRPCATGRRSAASRSPASAASSARTRSTPSPRPRTSSSAPRTDPPTPRVRSVARSEGLDGPRLRTRQIGDPHE